MLVKNLIRRGPGNWVPTLIAMCALFVALGGPAYAAKKISGSTIANRSIPATKIKKNALGPNEINESKLAKKLPSVPNAKLAERATSTDGLYNSGLIKLSVGQQKVVTTRGPFEFTAVCVDGGAGVVNADLNVKNVGSVPAIEEDDEDSNYNPPTTLAPGDSTDVFYSVSNSSPYWFGESYNMFALASEDGTAINGQGQIGVKVLGADCAFQLNLFN